MDPEVYLEHGTRKAHANKESGVAVFFYIEAYDMMWGEGLKLGKLGITGKIYRWRDFLRERIIQVRIRMTFSTKFVIGTPQGSIVSLLIFSIMINYVY